MAAVLEDNAAAEDRLVVDDAFAGGLGSVPENAFVADLRIVRYVNAFEQEVPVADRSDAVRIGSPVDDRFFTDRVVVADHQNGFVSPELEVLRGGAQDGALVNGVAGSHPGAVQHAGVRHDRTVVADFDILIDVCERVNGHVLPDFRTGVYMS